MYNKKSKKYITILVSVLLLVCCTVGSVIAYLVDKTPEIKNTFVPTTLTTHIDEDFKNNVKEHVKITNTGDVDAFVRAQVIITWKKKGTPDEVLSQIPVENTDYSISYGNDGWIKGDDNFWYYTSAVAPSSETTELITKCEVLQNAPVDGYTLSVEIIASSIQAKPLDVFNDDDKSGWANSSGLTATESGLTQESN